MEYRSNFKIIYKCKKCGVKYYFKYFDLETCLSCSSDFINKFNTKLDKNEELRINEIKKYNSDYIKKTKTSKNEKENEKTGAKKSLSDRK